MPAYTCLTTLRLPSKCDALWQTTVLTEATDRYRLSAGANEKIQLTALLGAFKDAVELSEKS